MTASPSVNPAAKRERILLVEDYDQFRELISMVLREDGYDVIEAGSGQEALELFSKYGKSIHLILTDIIMPSMSGVHLVERIRTVAPRVKVIFMSAYARSKDVQQAIAGQKVSFFEKSNKLTHLCAKVREVLDERHPIVEWFKRNVSGRLTYAPSEFRTSSSEGRSTAP